jgi:uncharacterized repeat protein (TIGR03943 family)
MTAFSFDARMVWWRIIFALIIVQITAFIVSFFKEDSIVNPEFEKLCHKHDHDSKLPNIFSSSHNEFWQLFTMLALGASIAAATQIFVPRFIINAVGGDIFLSVGYILPPKPLSPSSLAQKESPVIIDPESRCEIPQPKENSSTISINCWRTAINSCRETAYFNGKDITITGFVSNDLLKNYGYNYFNIARYVISCCTVDSVPMKILVEKNFSTDYPDGIWLIVKGKLSQKIINSQAEYVITNAHITKINQPKYPYELLGI